MKMKGLHLAIGICFILLLTWSMTYIQRPNIQLTDQRGNVKLSRKCPLLKDCTSNHFAFYIRSGAANVVPPKICFNGQVIMSAANINVGRGLNMALLDSETGSIVSCEFFKGSNDLLVFMRGIKPGHIVLTASFDDPASMLTGEIRELFKGLGSSFVDTVGTRDGWVFAGQKGLKESQFEKHIPNDEKINRYERWPGVIEMSGCLHKRI